MNTISQKQAKLGDIIEVGNGNRYLVLPNHRKLYVGNRDHTKIPESETLELHKDHPCEIIGHLVLE